jgi:small subunit ribosomal protein S20
VASNRNVRAALRLATRPLTKPEGGDPLTAARGATIQPPNARFRRSRAQGMFCRRGKFLATAHDPETLMANTPSAKKAVRKIARRTAINKARRSRVRSFLRRVEEAIHGGDQGSARSALQAAEPEIMRAAQKGVLPRNAASRKVSRLSARIKAMQG